VELASALERHCCIGGHHVQAARLPV
jgi:hypothetical protein